MKIFFSPILDLIHFVLCCLPKIEQESIFTVETFEFIQKNELVFSCEHNERLTYVFNEIQKICRFQSWNSMANSRKKIHVPWK